MGNNPHVPNGLVYSDVQSKAVVRHEHTTAQKAMLSRTTIAGALIAAAIAALAVTSLVHADQQATAPSDVAMAQVRPAPAMPFSVPLDSGEIAPFAFGFLVFEHDTTQHLPGFAALPSGAPAR